MIDLAIHRGDIFALLVLNNFLGLLFSRIVYSHNLGCFKSENVYENIEFSFDQNFLKFVHKQVFSILVWNMSLLRTGWTTFFEFVDRNFSTIGIYDLLASSLGYIFF